VGENRTVSEDSRREKILSAVQAEPAYVFVKRVEKKKNEGEARTDTNKTLVEGKKPAATPQVDVLGSAGELRKR